MELTEMSIEVEPNLLKFGLYRHVFRTVETGPSVRQSTEALPNLTKDVGRVY